LSRSDDDVQYFLWAATAFLSTLSGTPASGSAFRTSNSMMGRPISFTHLFFEALALASAALSGFRASSSPVQSNWTALTTSFQGGTTFVDDFFISATGYRQSMSSSASCPASRLVKNALAQSPALRLPSSARPLTVYFRRPRT